MDIQASLVSKSATFADLESATYHLSDSDTWPRSPMRKEQARSEFAYALRLIRVYKRGLAAAVDSGNPVRISAWQKERAAATVSAFVTRERFHRPTTYLRAPG